MDSILTRRTHSVIPFFNRIYWRVNMFKTKQEVKQFVEYLRSAGISVGIKRVTNVWILQIR
jgi:hypothetical protein